MNKRNLVLAACVLVLGSGCGDGKESTDQARSPVEEAAQLDSGPRAREVMVLDAELAAKGEVLFDVHSCSDCHTLGEADLAPDLRDVLNRRAKPWLLRQIVEPKWMNAHDPIAKELIAQYGLEMVTVGATAAEAEAILQYLLREAGSIRP